MQLPFSWPSPLVWEVPLMIFVVQGCSRTRWTGRWASQIAVARARSHYHLIFDLIWGLKSPCSTQGQASSSTTPTQLFFFVFRDGECRWKRPRVWWIWRGPPRALPRTRALWTRERMVRLPRAHSCSWSKHPNPRFVCSCALQLQRDREFSDIEAI